MMCVPPSVRLLLADLDGTLVESWQEIPLLGIRECLEALRRQGVTIAVVTNQGGVGYRYVHERQGEREEAARYPTFAQVQDRLSAITRVRPIDCLYASLHHGRDDWPVSDERRHVRFDAPLPMYFSWRAAWHKPQPEMLLQALEDGGVEPSDALMVGDRPEDQEAARAAGVPFLWQPELIALITPPPAPTR